MAINVDMVRYNICIIVTRPPMDKIFTQSTFSSQQSASGAVRPSRITLAKIKQFAHAYTCVRSMGKLDGIVLN